MKFKTVMGLLRTSEIPLYPIVKEHQGIELYGWPVAGGMTTKLVHMAREFTNAGNRVAFLSSEINPLSLQRRFENLWPRKDNLKLFPLNSFEESNLREPWDVIIIDDSELRYGHTDRTSTYGMSIEDLLVAEFGKKAGRDIRVIAGINLRRTDARNALL